MTLISKILLISMSVVVPGTGVTAFIAKELKDKYPNKTFIEQIKSVAGKNQDQTSTKKDENKNLSEHFLQIGNTNKKPEDIVKEILKTYTGSKLLLEKIVETLIDKWSEDTSKQWENSETFKNFNTKKTQLKKDIENSEQLQTTIKLNGGKKEDYSKIMFLDSYKTLLIELLEEHIDIYLNGEPVDSDDYDEKTFDAAKSNFVDTTPLPTDANKKVISFHGHELRDKFKAEISSIWQHIFQQWVLSEKTKSVKQLTWRYATAFKQNDHEFNDTKKDLIKLPERPNYYFPSFNEAAETKFKEFVKKIDSLDTLDENQKITDLNDFSQINRVINVSTSNLSSREAVAFIYLQKTDIFNSVSGTPVWPTATSSIKKIKKSELNDKKILEIFGIKPNEKFPDNKTNIKDFVIVEDSQGILYRDMHGIHYITQKDIKKTDLLINTLQKHKVVDKQQFDLFPELKTYLKNNFYTLVMNYFHSKNITNTASNVNTAISNCTASAKPCVVKSGSNNCANADEVCLYQLGKSLSDIFAKEQSHNKIKDLNKLLLKDYFQDINTNLIITTESAKINDAKELNKGFYVTFPETINWTKSTPQQPLISMTSNIFTPHTLPQTPTTSSAEFTTYKSNVDILLTSKTSTKKSNKISFSFINNQSRVDAKQINIDFFLEAIFLKCFSSNLIKTWLLNQEKYKHIKNYNFSTHTYKNDVGDSEFVQKFDENYFKKQNPPSTDFQKALNNSLIKENNLWSLFKNKNFFEFKNWIPDVNGDEKLIDFLTSSDITKNTINSSNYIDELSSEYSQIVDQWNTIFWLIDNNFDNYKKHLQMTVNTNGSGAFVFSNKFDSKLCPDISFNDDKTKDENHKKLWKYEKTLSNINKQFLGTAIETTDNNGCVDLYDQFSSVKTKINSVDTEISGYKGFVHAGNHNNILNMPSNLWSKIFNKLKDDKFKSGYLHGNSYSSYVISVKKDDVKNLDTFLTTNNISAELILYDIVKLSKDAAVQKNAISDFLSKDKLWIENNKYNKIIVGDWRLKNTIPFEWQASNSKP